MEELCPFLKKKETAEEKKKRVEKMRQNVVYTEHNIELDVLLAKYGTHPKNGLTSQAADAALEKYGPNELTPPKVTPLWIKFVNELTGFFSLLLCLGGVLCSIAYGILGNFADLVLGMVLFIVVIATGIFSFYQNSKADSLMDEFKKLKPPSVKVYRDGELMERDASKITIGDVVHVKTGDLVPGDLRVLEVIGNATVDNASLTGESEPQKRKIDCTNDDPMETANLAFFGTQVPEGEIIGVVIKIGDDTFMGSIARLALTTEKEQTPINKEIEHFITIISVIAIFLGVAFLIISLALGYSPIACLVFCIGIIVANVPEGLLTTVTVCLTLTAKRMYVKQVLVKDLEGVETLGSTSCICSDKTGTLTQNIMTVAQVVYGEADGCKIQEAGSSFSKGVKTFDENSPAFVALVRCATLNNTCFFDKKGANHEEDSPDLPFNEYIPRRARTCCSSACSGSPRATPPRPR